MAVTISKEELKKLQQVDPSTKGQTADMFVAPGAAVVPEKDAGVMQSLASDMMKKSGEEQAARKEYDESKNTKPVPYSVQVIQSMIQQQNATKIAEAQAKKTEDEYVKMRNTMDQLSGLSDDQLNDPDVLKMLKYSNPNWDISKIKEKAVEWRNAKSYFNNLPIDAKVSDEEEKYANSIGMRSQDHRNGLIGIAGTMFNVINKAAQNTGEAFPDSDFGAFGVEAKNERAQAAADEEKRKADLAYSLQLKDLDIKQKFNDAQIKQWADKNVIDKKVAEETSERLRLEWAKLSEEQRNNKALIAFKTNELAAENMRTVLTSDPSNISGAINTYYSTAELFDKEFKRPTVKPLATEYQNIIKKYGIKDEKSLSNFVESKAYYYDVADFVSWYSDKYLKKEPKQSVVDNYVNTMKNPNIVTDPIVDLAKGNQLSNIVNNVVDVINPLNLIRRK